MFGHKDTSAICLENFKSLLNKIAEVDPLALIQLSNQYEAGGNQLKRRECGYGVKTCGVCVCARACLCITNHIAL